MAIEVWIDLIFDEHIPSCSSVKGSASLGYKLVAKEYCQVHAYLEVASFQSEAANDFEHSDWLSP